MRNNVLKATVLTSLLLGATVSGVRAASVGVSGYTNSFASQPPAADWATAPLAGATADITTAAGLDAGVQGVVAGNITAQPGADPADPPALLTTAVWSSTGQYLQSRPTGNGATLMLCTLVNNIGGDANALNISYDFAKIVPVTEEVEGHRAYYSLTGAAGSWVVIPALASANPGRVTASVPLTWPAGGTVYLLLADENGSPSPDTALQIDNFSATATPSTLVPVAITSQPQSQTVTELAPASFTVGVSGNPSPTFQWYKNDAAIGGATAATYQIPAALLSDSGAQFKVVAANTVSNVNYSVTSSPPVVLTVNADTVQPVLVRAFGAPPSTVSIEFSEPIRADTANVSANYTITSAGGNLTVMDASLSANGTNVILTTSAQTVGTLYTLTVNGIRDVSAAGNLISANSTATFTPAALTATDIGAPAIPGQVVNAGGGYNITAGGTNIAGNSDQFTMHYQQVSGDFDFKVRLDGLAGADVWSKAGLMARETLTANSRYAAMFATPSVSGAFFSSRTALGAPATNAGSFLVSYPDTWLRLRRQGTNFTGYAGVDGQNWMQVGTINLVAPSGIFYVGMALTSASASSSAAQFREFIEVPPGTGTIGQVALLNEPLGPSSRNTGLAITEIMYHPKPTNDMEFIEIFNSKQVEEDLEGYRFSGDVNYTFPAGTVLKAGAFLVVARYPSVIASRYNLSGVHGPWTADGTNSTALPDNEGRIRLRNKTGAVLLEVNYLGESPWPLAADGAGHSLVLARPSYGEDDYRAWSASDKIGGTPGRMESFGVEPLRSVVINEFLANTDDTNVLDFIELFNNSGQSNNISGAYLSDDRDTNRFRIPNNTILGPKGFISFNQSQLGFSLSSGGERLYLVNSNQNRVIEAVVFEAQADGVSSGRSPDGAPLFHELTSRTPGTANTALFIRDIVINEIMYNPITGQDNDEYVELYNKGSNTINVSGWRFTDGIDYTMPPNTLISSNGYLVIAKNAQHLRTNYTGLTTANTLGDFSGTLANGGERVALAMPDYFLATNNTIVTTQANYIVVDEVIYGEGGRWGDWADGGGSSLELIDPRADNRLPPNWADSDETAKSSWTTVEQTAPLDNGNGAVNEVQMFILGRGECLVDDVEIRSAPGGANLVANGTFEGGTTGWFFGGNHIRSTLRNEGFNSTRSLHLRASGGGDNGANRVETDCGTPTTPATLRCKARWLRGHRDLLMKVHGNQIEAVGTLSVPTNLGTPGAPNSQRLNNGGPAITSIAHTPVLPAAGQPVVVSARISDNDGIASVQLRYRIDPSSALNSVNMRDDGTGGDVMAGDGIYSATVPSQSANVLAAFRIQATDGAPSAATSQFPSDAPVREGHIRWGETPLFGNQGVYRLWMTSSNITFWGTREKLSNEPLDATFIYGNFRVIYNAGGRYRGSPFLRPGYSTPIASNPCAYVWSLPEDEPMLGTDELNLDSLEPNARDSTLLREITAFWIAEQMGLTFSYQRYVHVVINGVANANRSSPIPAFSDSQQPNSEYMASWFPDDPDGEIFKIDDWFEFNDTLTGPDREFNIDANLQPYYTLIDGKVVRDQARYRNSWEKKSNKGLDDDYSSLFAMVDAFNTPTNGFLTYVNAVESIVDAKEWMTVFALRHSVSDWDGYGYDRGKNQFVYRPQGGKFQMLLWDLDFALGCTGGHAPTLDLLKSNNDPTMNVFLSVPHFRRMYYRALLRLAQGPYTAEKSTPPLDARYKGLQNNGITTVSPFVPSGAAPTVSLPTWLGLRRTNIFSLMNAAITNGFNVAGALHSTNANSIVNISGTGNINIDDILINGQRYGVTWTTITSWTARVSLEPGTNSFAFNGRSTEGLTNTSTIVATIVHTGQPIALENSIVFNEVLYNPVIPNASFVELLNRSGTTIDMSGWKINGLDYTFPTPTFSTNGQYLILAKNRSAFASAFGTNFVSGSNYMFISSSPVYDTFDGNFDPDGETLTLYKPGTNAATDLVIDKIRYENRLPWPPNAAFGTSLQLVDASVDNSRSSDWASGGSWVNVTRTANISTGTNLLVWLTAAGNCFIDDISIVETNESSTNIVLNGDFESDLSGPWIVPAIYSTSYITNGVAHSGNRSLFINGTAAGSGLNVIQQWIGARVPTNLVCTLSYWILVHTNAVTVRVRTLPGSAIDTTAIAQSIIATPGAHNIFAASLPPYDPLWLNELQASNVAGITDNFGDRDPWVEIYNGSPNPLTLDGYFLAEQYGGNLQQWPFPNGVTVGPRQFKIVWLDNEPQESVGVTHLHANFRLPSTTGTVALVRLVGGAPQITDYLTYANLGAGLSYGDYPDGQPFVRRAFQSVTPSGTNISRGVNVFINEWMAGNTTNTLFFDPADGDYNDWFELYNAGDEPVDLSGYYLTDNLGDATKYQIPLNSNYIIPPHGFLLVWADAEPEQNNSDRPDLHVSFRLSGFFGSIGLFAPDGVSQIDAIDYGQQTDDVSQGRCADGASTPFVFFLQGLQDPSPRAANHCGINNLAPTLAPIGDRMVRVDQTLSFNALASDPEAPPQTLTFGLMNGPAGATIGALSGLFTWTPTLAQANSTNQVTISVSDNGTPPLSDSETITIIALPRPQAGIMNNAGNLTISFDTIPGRAYRVEYKTNLDDPMWQPLTENTPAAGTTMTVPDVLGAENQRFYRIVETN